MVAALVTIMVEFVLVIAVGNIEMMFLCLCCCGLTTRIGSKLGTA